jgi:hypothetical protein
MRLKATHKAGFAIADFMMAKGETRHYSFDGDASRYNDIDSCAIYLSGHFTLTDPDGKIIAERPPGTFTEDRPDLIKKGTYVLTATETGSRWICVQSKTSFDCCKLELGQDQLHTLPPGQCYLHGLGQLDPDVKPGTIVVDQDRSTMLRGVTPTIGILLWR